ncbi:MAG TPA: hypothetical protein VN667_14540 [Burkholderiales bacterium]|nr:hypothetical protein [Burkholderiales bacterium]
MTDSYPVSKPCPQCASPACGPISCRFSGIQHPAPAVHDFRDCGDPMEKVERPAPLETVRGLQIDYQRGRV